MRNIDMIVIHAAATPPSMDIGVQEIDRWHRAKGWLSVGYHFVIRRDGTLEDGRPVEKSGAHAAGYNKSSIGICLVGGLAADRKTPENNFTVEQFTTLEGLVEYWHGRFPAAQILGHRDLPDVTKACPCFEVREWAAGLKK